MHLWQDSPFKKWIQFLAMHDFSSKTLSSNMTTRRIRLLVENNGQVRHLVDFIFSFKTNWRIFDGSTIKLIMFHYFSGAEDEWENQENLPRPCAEDGVGVPEWDSIQH